MTVLRFVVERRSALHEPYQCLTVDRSPCTRGGSEKHFLRKVDGAAAVRRPC